MARSAEKARSMLYRFRNIQREEQGLKHTEERPTITSECHSLDDAERYRRDLMRDIKAKVENTFEMSLSDEQIRDLNDSINKELKEKRAWEHRIKELGGPDNTKRVNLLAESGAVVPGTSGYRYFGRARDLPGVKELFAEFARQKEDAKATVITQRVDASYYGFGDEDDGLVVSFEEAQEAIAREKFLAKSKDPVHHFDENTLPMAALPSRTQMEAFLVQKRKQALLEKYL